MSFEIERLTLGSNNAAQAEAHIASENPDADSVGAFATGDFYGCPGRCMPGSLMPRRKEKKDMSEPFLAEIRIFGFNFAPPGWAFCDGQILPINQNQSLYSLLGTTYGGDGETSFALPDLRGRTPVHVGSGFNQGQKSGEETHTLSAHEMPQHQHVLQASSNAGNLPAPSGQVLANGGRDVYGAARNMTGMSTGAIANVGGGQAHENMQPYLALNFAIALQGLFPSEN